LRSRDSQKQQVELEEGLARSPKRPPTTRYSKPKEVAGAAGAAGAAGGGGAAADVD